MPDPSGDERRGGGDENRPAEAAAAAAAPGGKRGGKGSKGKGKGGKAKAAKGGDKTCYKCGEAGHMARDCPAAAAGGDAVAATADAPAEQKGGKRKGGKGGKKEGGKKGGDKGNRRAERAAAAAAAKDAAAAGLDEEGDDDSDTAEGAAYTRPSGRHLPPDPTRQAKGPRRAAVEGLTADHTELAQTAIEALTNGSYECLICYAGVKTRHATWSCTTCHKIFHLSCTKQWGRSATGGFRCPQCSEEYARAPSKYLCFCGGTRDPADDGYNTPHSCGETCGRSRGEGCAHPCQQQCHPGPCPPCTELGPVRRCPCGDMEYRLGCGEPDPRKTCGKVCGRPLNCGQHVCERTCHAGECDPCAEVYPQQCLCGRVVEEERVCDGAEVHMVGDRPATFRCFEPCGKTLGCGKHKCALLCHLGECPPCELTPEEQITCPCGKRSLQSLNPRPKQRTACTDPIATCGAQCGKKESCEKHGCQMKCHEGECGPCKAQVSITCNCGASTIRVQCSSTPVVRNGPGPTPDADAVAAAAALVWPPRCTRRCGVTKTCGRHKCNTVCCKEGNRTHPCTDLCRRKLECGNHHCEERCHAGGCAPCRHIVVDELSCFCGAEVVEPPQPCGTEPPTCDRACSIAPPCGHQPAPHSCHYGPCPLCTTRVDKRCAGGHSDVTVPCHLQNPTCSAECAQTLPCGRHKCEKKCHAGPCPVKKEGAESCGHVCGVLLPCDHPCQAVCHDPKVSPHTKECKAKVDIKCLCGRMTQKIPCYQYSQKSRSLAGKRGGSGWRTPTIPCDTECQHEERMSSFASALGIDKSRDSELAFQGANSLTPLRSTVYNQTIWLALQQQTQHVRLLERTFDDFLIEVSRTRMMQPMNEEKRRVVHELAAYYGLTVQTFDQEPNKTCQLTKTPHTKKPVPLLSEWKQDPLELAQTRATDYPESVIVFQEITNPDKYRECIKVLRPYVGRWIGFKKGGTMYCVAFMDTQDAQVCFNNLTKDKVPIKFQLLLDYNQDQAARQAAGVSAGSVFSGGAAGTTKVFTSGGRRSQMAAASSAPPPTGGSGGTWAGRSAASSSAVPQAYQPPAVPLASTRWESLGKKK